jgi:hypothetical protein
VHFSDTDAAGVMHFQHLLGWCHQAWEDSLEQFGIQSVRSSPVDAPISPAWPCRLCIAVQTSEPHYMWVMPSLSSYNPKGSTRAASRS